MGDHLTAARVAAVLMDSLFTDDEFEESSREDIQAKAVVVDGVCCTSR